MSLVMPPRFYVAEILRQETPEGKSEALDRVPSHLKGLVITNVTNILEIREHNKIWSRFRKQRSLI